MGAPMTEQAIELASVEQVFGLTGGELESEPWIAAHAYRDDGSEITSYPVKFAYWYTGVPEWAGEDFWPRGERSYHEHDFATVIDLSPVYGTTPLVLIDADGSIWVRTVTYAHSGETDCPYSDGSETEVEPDHCVGRENCPFCEVEIGETHSVVYIGDCAERVYRRMGKVRTRQIFLTYDLVTPESAEQGDTSEHGFMSPGNYDHPMDPECVGAAFEAWKAENVVPCWEEETDDDLSPVEHAIRFLRSGGYSEPSSSVFHAGVWYSWADRESDYRSGESRGQSAHLEGFTVAEQREIWIAISGKGAV